MSGFGQGIYGGGTLFGGAPIPPFVPPASASNGTVRRAILALVLALSGLPDGGVVWSDQSRGFVPPVQRALVRLSMLPARRRGISDGRAWVDNGAGKMVQTVSGIRLVTLSIACDCYEQGDDETSYPILDRIRDGLAWDSSRETLLAAANVCRSSDTDIVTLPKYVADSRVVSTATFDVVLSIGVQRTDANNPYYWIETAEVSGNL